MREMVFPSTNYIIFDEYIRTIFAIERIDKEDPKYMLLRKQIEVYTLLLDKRDQYRYSDLTEMVRDLSDFGFDHKTIEHNLQNFARSSIMYLGYDKTYTVWLLDDVEDKKVHFKAFAHIRSRYKFFKR